MWMQCLTMTFQQAMNLSCYMREMMKISSNLFRNFGRDSCISHALVIDPKMDMSALNVLCCMHQITMVV